MTTDPADRGDRKWITLGLARAILGINEATLRQWADHGLVRAFRTPGGHRRFAADDIYALMQGDGASRATSMHLSAGSAMLPSIRRRVKGTTRPHLPAWLERFDNAGQDRMRGLGREFLDLCLAFIETPDDVNMIERAADLGQAYGKEIATRGIPLTDALEAFVFFRNATTGAIKPSLVSLGSSAEEAYGTLEVLSLLTDQVLLSLAAYYDQTPVLEPHQAPTG
jgi:hypothetical protein